MLGLMMLEVFGARHATEGGNRVFDSRRFLVGEGCALFELIEEIERRYQIRFTESDLADPRFATLAGLSAIVDARRAATTR